MSERVIRYDFFELTKYIPALNFRLDLIMIPKNRQSLLIKKTVLEEIMASYECPCGYVYDPAEGDYENGIEPGTDFEDLPDEWVCPKCGAEKEYFEKID